MNEPDVERQVTKAASLMTEAIETALPSHRLRVAAIIGGYGRGEGGVEKSNGQFKPHNNLDVLVVTKGGQNLESHLKKDLQDATERVAEGCGIPVDLGCVTETLLTTSRPRVMWYDVRHGHRVLCGDATFLSALDRYRADNIPVDDVIDLVTNRGALAVIAKELMLAKKPSAWSTKQALKGTMKAIVGYGDAILWQRGLYHASYQEKGLRMAQTTGIDEALRSLYAEAIEFRFFPDYQRYEGRETEWILAAIDTLEEAHRCFARAQLGTGLSWSMYGEAILRLCIKKRGIRGWISHAKAESRNYWELSGPPRPRDTWLERASLERHRIAALLPSSLYQGGDIERRGFIRRWARECDANFPKRLTAELRLEPAI